MCYKLTFPTTGILHPIFFTWKCITDYYYTPFKNTKTEWSIIDKYIGKYYYYKVGNIILMM